MQQKGTGKSSLLFTPMSPGSNFLSSAARMTKSLRSKTDQGAPSRASAKRFQGIFSAPLPRVSRPRCLPLYAVDFCFRRGSITLQCRSPLQPFPARSLSLSLPPHCRSCEFCALVCVGVCVRLRIKRIREKWGRFF